MRGLDELTFHVLGGLVTWTEEDVNPNDPRTAQYYRIADGTLASLYSRLNTSLTAEGGVRLLRFVVRNPAPQPVLVNVRTEKLWWAAKERWANVFIPDYSEDSFSRDGFNFPGTETFANQAGAGTYDGCYESTTCCDAEGQTCWACTESRTIHQYPYDCGAPPQNGFPTHFRVHVYGGAKYECLPEPMAAASGSDEQALSDASLRAVAYSDPVETRAPSPFNNNQFIVPAATPAGPGALVIYLGRPFDDRRRVQLPAFAAGLFEYAYADLWRASGTAVKTCRDQALNPKYLYNEAQFLLQHWRKVLADAREEVNGELNVETRGVQASDSIRMVGEPRPVVNVSLQRRISH
jgi:hypothetical protein